MDHYKTLGVDKDADSEAIEKAYKSRAKKLHPDVGGDEEEFKQLVHAYRILSDDHDRAHYDRTGTDPRSEPSGDEMAWQIITNILGEAVEKLNPETDDLVEKMIEAAHSGINSIEDQIAKLQMRKSKFERTEKRFKNRRKRKNRLRQTVQWQIDQFTRMIEARERERTAVERAIAILEEYGYDYERAIGPTRTPHFFATINA